MNTYTIADVLRMHRLATQDLSDIRATYVDPADFSAPAENLLELARNVAIDDVKGSPYAQIWRGVISDGKVLMDNISTDVVFDFHPIIVITDPAFADLDPDEIAYTELTVDTKIRSIVATKNKTLQSEQRPPIFARRALILPNA